MASPQAENEDGVNVNQQGPLSTAALFNSSHETPTAVEAKIIGIKALTILGDSETVGIAL